MDLVIWIAVLFMIGSAVTGVHTKNQIGRMLGSKPAEQQPKAIEAPKKSDSHSLVRTWIVSSRDMSIPPGWRWKCHCGVWGVAKDASFKGESLGTEDEAINGFKNHAHQYNEVNVDFYRAKFDKEQADFAEYRKLCYCKETNHDLLKWRGI